MKWFLRCSSTIFLSVFFASLKINFADDYFSVIYTVLGITFSVGVGQVLSFSFSEIPNNDFVIHQRTQLNSILITFVFLFAIATLVFALHKINWEYKIKIFVFSLNTVFGSFYIFCIIYFIRNFFSLFHLKNEIEDLIRKNK